MPENPYEDPAHIDEFLRDNGTILCVGASKLYELTDKSLSVVAVVAMMSVARVVSVHGIVEGHVKQNGKWCITTRANPADGHISQYDGYSYSLQVLIVHLATVYVASRINPTIEFDHTVGNIMGYVAQNGAFKAVATRSPPPEKASNGIPRCLLGL